MLGRAPPTCRRWARWGWPAPPLVLANRRVAGALLALASIAGVLDEAENGPRIVRRVLRRRKTTVNVVARAGDPGAARTLVLLAHHDAAQTGRLFDQALQSKLNERFPGLLRRVKTQPPQWWVGVAGQLAGLPAPPTGRRSAAAARARDQRARHRADRRHHAQSDRPRRQRQPVGRRACSSRSPSGSATSRSRACAYCSLSAGAEETLQDGIRAFVARHRRELDPDSTWVLNMDTIGSPRLIMLEGEGPFHMQRLHRPGVPRPDRALRRRAGHRARARLPRPRLNRQRDHEPRRLSEHLPRVAQRVADDVQLPPDDRRPGEPRLRHHRARRHGSHTRWRTTSPSTARPSRRRRRRRPGMSQTLGRRRRMPRGG